MIINVHLYSSKVAVTLVRF